jgi:biopolymer transport protein ExbD
MTPLVDVVMVILVFLMRAGTFGSASLFLVSKPVVARHGSAIAFRPGQSLDTPIEIRLDNSRDGLGFLAMAPGMNGAMTNPTLLHQWLVAKRRQLIQAGNPPDRLRVTIAPSRSVKYRYLIQVYEAALKAEYGKIALTTSR